MKSKVAWVIIFATFTMCSSRTDNFHSQIILQDDLLIVRSDYIDTLELNKLHSKNILLAIPEKRKIRNGDVFRAKMFFLNYNLYNSKEPGTFVSYKMHYKEGRYKEKKYDFKEIEPILDTAYISIPISEKTLKEENQTRWWSGKIDFNINGKTSTFFLEQELNIEN